MNIFFYSLFWNFIIWILLVLILFFLKKFNKNFQNYIDYITALTVGLLLWIIFLWFFPEIVYHTENFELAFGFVLIWILGFYILELFLHWHHCRDLSIEWHTQHVHEHGSWKMILVWTILHNIFHGVEIFVAFAIDFNFWIAVTVAILLHSIPQNIVNYLMNHNNFKIVIIWAFSGVIWSLLIFPFREFIIENDFLVLSIMAGGLLYIALADIFPTFKLKWTLKNKALYLIFIILGLSFSFIFNELWSHEHWENFYDSEENNIEHILENEDNH